MHTCSTSTSPPSLDQKVEWRDRLDLQHDGVVYMVENFCCRASPTNSREGERKAAGLLGFGGRCVWRGRPSPLYIEGEGAANPSPSSKPWAGGQGIRRSGGIGFYLQFKRFKLSLI